MKKNKPIIPQSHMDASYRGMLTSLSNEIDQLYVKKESFTLVKAPTEQENDEAGSMVKLIDQLEKQWNVMVKQYVPSDRAEQKRCLITIAVTA